MNRIGLTKGLIAGNSLRVLGDGWVSNAHWLIARHRLKERDAVLLRHPEAASVVYGVPVEAIGTNKDAEKTIAKGLKNLRRFYLTGWVYQDAEYFETADEPVLVTSLAINYARPLGLIAGWSEGPEKPFYDAPTEPSIVLMPFKGVELPAWATERTAREE